MMPPPEPAGGKPDRRPAGLAALSFVEGIPTVGEINYHKSLIRGVFSGQP
jgi:hypothetical protein